MISFVSALLFVVPQTAPAEFTRSVLHVPSSGTRLALRDVDGDGDSDLILIDDRGVHVRLMADDGAFPDASDRMVPWAATNLAWTLVEREGRTMLATFSETGEVRSYPLDGQASPAEGALDLSFAGSLPRGRFEMNFYRDIDQDGRLDLVLPSFGSYAIFLRQTDGTWSQPLEVRLEAEVDYSVGDPDSLDALFGQEISIPWFRLEDIDGDGDVDLVAETEEEIQFHLAEPTLSSDPSWRLDLEALRAELPPPGDFDMGNVLGELSRTVEWRILDLDGVQPNDLILQVGPKFRVYRDAARTGPGEQTPQILKSSGNVMGFFLRDIEGSELPDLQVLRGQDLSVAAILRWLLLPGSFDFELFTYENEGGTFSRRPTRRNKLELEIPRLLAFIDEIEELEEELESVESIPARIAAMGNDGLANDIIDIRGEDLVIFTDCAPLPDGEADSEQIDDLNGALEAFLLKDVDALEDGKTKTFALRDLMDMDFQPGAAARAACEGHDPAHTVPLAPGLLEPTLHARDLDGNGEVDVIVAGRGEEEGWIVQFLVR